MTDIEFQGRLSRLEREFFFTHRTDIQPEDGGWAENVNGIYYGSNHDVIAKVFSTMNLRLYYNSARDDLAMVTQDQSIRWIVIIDQKELFSTMHSNFIHMADRMRKVLLFDDVSVDILTFLINKIRPFAVCRFSATELQLPHIVMDCIQSFSPQTEDENDDVSLSRISSLAEKNKIIIHQLLNRFKLPRATPWLEIVFLLRAQPDECISVTDLIYHLGLQPAVVSRLVARLERTGVVSVSRDLLDKRRKKVKLSKDIVSILK